MSSVALKPASCQVRDIYIQSGSEVFDLHNDFDFVGFTYDTAQRTVCLRWVPNKHASAKQHHALVLEMGGVSFLSSTPRDSDVPFSEDSCLHQIGRIPPSAPTLDTAESDAPPDWHYIFSFMSGFMLRIAAESVCLRTHDI